MKKAFLLLTFSLVLVEGYTQKRLQSSIHAEIDYNRADLAKYTTDPNSGNIFPVDNNNSIAILGQAKILLLNNYTGKIIKNFDEASLKQKVEESIQQFYNGSYVVPIQEEEYKDLPYCAKFPFYYDRFFKVDDHLYACYIRSSVISIDPPRNSNIISGIGFFDDQLELKDYYSMESNTKPGALYGAGFMKKNIFWARYANPAHKNSSDFVLFENKSGNRYELKGEIANIPRADKMIYYPGRFFSIASANNGYLVNTGTKLIWSDDFSKPGTEMTLHLEADEALAIIEQVNEHRFVGLKIKMDEEGAGITGALFETDRHFRESKTLKEYDFLKCTVNSMKVLNGNLYIFYFDRENDHYMLEIMDLNGGKGKSRAKKKN